MQTVPVFAMPTVSPDFFSTQNAAEEFFEVGRQQLEREIQRLEQLRGWRSEQILHVDEQAKLKETELENGDGLQPQRQPHQRQIH